MIQCYYTRNIELNSADSHTSFPGELCLKGLAISGLALGSFSGGRAATIQRLIEVKLVNDFPLKNISILLKAKYIFNVQIYIRLSDLYGFPSK